MTTKCNNWNSDKPEKLFNADGRAIGVLMPRIVSCTKDHAVLEQHTAEIFNIADYRKKSDA